MSWNYADYEYVLSAALLVIAMFGMGTTVTPRDFERVVRVPQGILLIVVMQALVSPLIAIGLARVFQLSDGVAVGLLLVAALPGGLFSNFLTYLGRGNVALSVSATALCTAGSLVTTSFILRVYGAAQLPDDFSMPVSRILFEITVCLLLPLLAGMWMRRRLPEHVEWTSKWCMNISLVLLGLVVAGALTSGRLKLSAYGWSAPLALLIFGIALVYLCCMVGKLIRLRDDDSFTVAIEVSVRNTHLGVLLKASLFPAQAGTSDPIGDGVLYAVLLYAGICIGIAISEVIAHRRGYGFYAPKEKESGDSQ